MFLECQAGSRISKGRYLGEKEASVLYILEQFIMPGRSRSRWVPMALHSWVQASITLKISSSERYFGRKRSLYAYMFVSAAVSKGACFDDFTMSVLHLSFYSNRARHELYISRGLSVAQFVDFSSV